MKIFLSYASADLINYQLEEIVEFLEFQDDIERVFYWERDTKGGQTFDDYMRNSARECDLLLVLFSENTNNSVPVFQEIGMAKAFEKPIMPIFDNIENIQGNINIRRGLKFSTDLRKFCDDLYLKITGKVAKHKEQDPLLDIKEKMKDHFSFDKTSYVEPQFKELNCKITYSRISFEDSNIPFIEFRIFKFMLFDPVNRGKINIITGPKGSGKSSLLKCIKYDFINAKILSKFIPIIINLNMLADQKEIIDLTDEDILNYIYNEFVPNSEDRYKDNFISKLEDGKLILLFDELDEAKSTKELYLKIVDFVNNHNARSLIAIRDTFLNYISEMPSLEEEIKIYRLNIFKESSLFEWIVLNKNNFEQTRNRRSEEIYEVLSKIIKDTKGEDLVLATFMQDYENIK